jgi:Fe-Mn family superoxide dismutase
MKYEQQPLPYDREALQPHVSGETLDYHHGKHHAAYINKFNAMVGDSPHADHAIEQIIKEGEFGGLYNQAAQHWNHAFYWHCLSPNGGGAPSGDLADGINGKWGSLDAFKAEFEKTSLGTFGSGWVWLAKGSDGLEIVSTKDAHNPIRDDKQPLITCDVWEHAYYIDYRNDRGKYVGAYWNLVNWDFAAKNLGESWTLPQG